jgi:hypothetical protein
VRAQPFGQAAAVGRLALEPGVRGRVLAFVEDRLQVRAVEVGVQLDAVVPTTQCGGQESTKSGCALKCAPGSTW